MPDLSDDLDKLIAGDVVKPEDQRYKELLSIDNAAAVHRPMLVVQPFNTNDVALVARYCTRHGLRFTVKSGGHSTNGYSLNSAGIVMDLGRMIDVRFDGEHLEIGGGAIWSHVYDFLEQSGDSRVPIGGSWPSVGVGGFVQGGGYSFLSRSYGLASDSLVATEIVKADGSVVTISADAADADDRELFWGLCGGGGGNFGVITKFVVRLHAAHAPLTAGRITFPFERMTEILEFYDDWTKELPDEMAVYGTILNQPDPRDSDRNLLALRLTPVFNGEFAKCMRLLTPLVELDPIGFELNAMTFFQWVRYVSSTNPGGRFGAYVRSAMLKQGDLAAAAKIIRKHVPNSPSPFVFVVWTHAGGQIKKMDQDRSSYPHRDAQYVFAVRAFWPPDQSSAMEANVEWAYHFFRELEPLSIGSYINYIDPLQPDWQSRLYGNNYSRLLDLKSNCDPQGVFSFQQGIGSTFDPTDVVPGQQLDFSPLFRTYLPAGGKQPDTCSKHD